MERGRLLRFDGLFAHQPDLEIARLMQGIHHFHHRLVIDGFIRAEEDGGIFAGGQAIGALIIFASVTGSLPRNMLLSAFTDR